MKKIVISFSQLLVLFLLFTSNYSCVEKTANSIIDNAINRLENTSDSWQLILEQTKQELIDSGHEVIANDVNMVVSNAIQDTSGEAKCFVDFIRSKLKDDLKRILSRITGNSIVLIPHFCTPNPHSINFDFVEQGKLTSLDISGYNLDYSKIKVFLVSHDGAEKDVSSHLGNPTEYLITLNLSTTGVPINSCSNKLRFDLKNNNSFTVNITHPKKSKKIIPQSRTRLCPKICGGDKEFNGNGPEVNATASLFIKDKKALWVKIYLKAKETKHDYTCTKGEWTYPVWEAPNNFEITDFSPSGVSKARYIDTNHQLDKPSISGSSLVRKFEIMGDTGGDDTGNCTGNDVYINTYFNEVSINYARVCN